MTTAEPPRDCPLCPRLEEFRDANRRTYPDYFNGPVADPSARAMRAC